MKGRLFLLKLVDMKPIANGICFSLVLSAALSLPARAGERSAARLFDAISKKDLIAVYALLTVDPGLATARDANGRTAVMAALFQLEGEGFVPPSKNTILKAVLARKPSLSFFEACAVGATGEVARRLHENPKLATRWNDFGWSALHLAAFSGAPDTALLLIEHGADVNARARTRFKNTPLQVALLPGQLETAALLLERGADPLERQIHGFTPLMEAALLGRRDLVDLLLDHGAELNSRADDGRNAVTEAVRGGHQELADYLRARGGTAAEITVNLKKPPE